MADHVFTPALALLYAGGLNDLRMALLMTNTTADTEVDAENPADITTLDTMDGSGYAEETLTSEAVGVDLSNDRAEIDWDDATFAAMSNGTRQIQGWFVKQNVDGNAANDLNKFYKDFASTINPGGSALTVQGDAQGWVQVANA